MAHIIRSVQGVPVDFDLLKIKQQLASTPAPVSVDKRRKFIDEKDGLKSTRSILVEDEPVLDDSPISDALALGLAAAEESAQAAE